MTFIDFAKELYQVQQEKKELEAREEMLKDQLKKMTNDEGKQEGGFKWGYQVRSGSIDYAKAAKQAYDLEQLEAYRKEPVKYWKLELYLEGGQ